MVQLAELSVHKSRLHPSAPRIALQVIIAEMSSIKANNRDQTRRLFSIRETVPLIATQGQLSRVVAEEASLESTISEDRPRSMTSILSRSWARVPTQVCTTSRERLTTDRTRSRKFESTTSAKKKDPTRSMRSASWRA